MKNLLNLRERFNITQKELAKILNLSQNAISKYENGITEPDIKTLILIADTFNVTIDWLVGRNTNNQKKYFTDEEKNKINEALMIINKKLNEEEF